MIVSEPGEVWRSLLRVYFIVYRLVLTPFKRIDTALHLLSPLTAYKNMDSETLEVDE